MRHLLIIIVCLSTSLGSVVAQPEWGPEGAEWFYTRSEFYNPETAEIARMFPYKDTIINGLEARILRTNIISAQDQSEEFLNDVIIHQDGRKVYRWIQEDFRLLYDFDLEVGDTIEIFVEHWPNQPEDTIAFLTVDSIITFEMGGLELKAQYLWPIFKGADDHAAQFFAWTFETIGNGFSFLPVHQLNCDATCINLLRCYTYDGHVLRNTSVECDSMSGIASSMRPNVQLDLSIAPNPGWAGEPLSIHAPNDLSIKQIDIYDLQGKLVSSSSSDFRNPMQPGIYFVKIRIENQMISKKLIVLQPD